jgi:hypothetical protein
MARRVGGEGTWELTSYLISSNRYTISDVVRGGIGCLQEDTQNIQFLPYIALSLWFLWYRPNFTPGFCSWGRLFWYPGAELATSPHLALFDPTVKRCTHLLILIFDQNMGDTSDSCYFRCRIFGNNERTFW